MLIIVLGAGRAWPHMQELLREFPAAEVINAGGIHESARRIDTRPENEPVVILFRNPEHPGKSNVPGVTYVDYFTDAADSSKVCIHGECWSRPKEAIRQALAG